MLRCILARATKKIKSRKKDEDLDEDHHHAKDSRTMVLKGSSRLFFALTFIFPLGVIISWYHAITKINKESNKQAATEDFFHAVPIPSVEKLKSAPAFRASSKKIQGDAIVHDASSDERTTAKDKAVPNMAGIGRRDRINARGDDEKKRREGRSNVRDAPSSSVIQIKTPENGADSAIDWTAVLKKVGKGENSIKIASESDEAGVSAETIETHPVHCRPFDDALRFAYARGEATRGDPPRRGLWGANSITIWTTVSGMNTTYFAAHPLSPYQGKQSFGGFLPIYDTKQKYCSMDDSPGLPNCPSIEEKRPQNPPVMGVFKELFLFTSNLVSQQHKNATLISYWDGRQNVLLPREKWEFRACTARENTGFCKQLYCCPQRSSKYTSFYDPKDQICKLMDRATMEPPILWGGICNCEHTCHTESATQLSSSWPYMSAREKFDYGVANRFNGSLRTLNGYDFPMPLRMERVQQPVNSPFSKAICKSAMEKRENLQAEGLTPKELLPNFIRTNFAHHLFFVPQIRLVYCGIPKVGMTEWLKLFRHVLGAKDYLGFPHAKWDLRQFQMSQLSPEKITEILHDSSWTKAVIMRDPAERLLSAYSDKIMKMKYTQRYFLLGELSDNPLRVLNFTEFVDLVTLEDAESKTHAERAGIDSHPTFHRFPKRAGLHYKTDPHWMPQMWTCGLDTIFPVFDFVGSFDHLSKHSKLLLQKVGAWDKWGATFDDESTEVGASNICTAGSDNNPNRTISGFNQKDPSNKSYKHSTGSKSKLDKYYTPELRSKVRRAYKMDYAVWDEIKDRDPDSVAAAYELDHVINECSDSQ